jgi:RNA polymerase sigma-70 factor, ECF subfamily
LIRATPLARRRSRKVAARFRMTDLRRSSQYRSGAAISGRRVDTCRFMSSARERCFDSRDSTELTQGRDTKGINALASRPDATDRGARDERGLASIPCGGNTVHVHPPMTYYPGTAALVADPATLAAGFDEARPVLVRQSFRQIFDEHAVAVGRTLRYLGIAEADVADAAQQVFLVVNRRYGEFEGRSSLSTWIREICVRVALSHRRHQRRRREDIVEDPPHRSMDPDQDADVERNQLRELLTNLLRTLDDNQRALIVLYDIEMLSMPEVARVLGCPLQTAYSRRATALDRLRRELLQHYEQSK